MSNLTRKLTASLDIRFARQQARLELEAKKRADAGLPPIPPKRVRGPANLRKAVTIEGRKVYEWYTRQNNKWVRSA